MLQTEDPTVVVVRRPETEGNFTFWLAEMANAELEQLKQSLDSGRRRADELPAMGEAMTLSEVMERLESRDFQVLDLPVQH